MNISKSLFCRPGRMAGRLACLLLVLLLPRSSGAAPRAATNESFSAMGREVADLLRTRDPARYAAAVSPSPEDWKSILSTNLPAKGDDPLKDLQDKVRNERQKVESSAKAFLAKADELHLDFSRGDLHTRVVAPRHLAAMHYPNLQAEGETVPALEKIEIMLAPDSPTNHPAQGDFKIAVRNLLKFPGGWRSLGGIQWEAFPANVADEKTARELALLASVAAHEGFTGQDDPALLKLGGLLVRFLRDRDLAGFEKEVLFNSDLVWAQFQRSGRKGPPRQELDQEMNLRRREQVEFARALLKQMDDAGIDLKNADIQIKEAALARAQPQGDPGSLDGLIGEQFKLVLTVKSDGKAKNGTSLSGDYILAVKNLLRFQDDWRVMDDVHWYQLPAGILDGKAGAAMKFENYVAEHAALPPDTAAPEIEFTALDGGKQLKLSDLRGKVVVLDFWATWCGPCQEPMAGLQTLRQKHPDWKDRVAIVPLSIDDTLQTVRRHVDQRGWTNTFNVWAGDGGWHSAPAKTFRVTRVPTTYLIDGQGKIVKAGHPAGMNLDTEVEALLKPAKP